MGKDKILLVEDNDILAANFSDFLKINGFDVTVALDRKSAENHINKLTFDLIILDVELKDEKEAGFDLCKFIKSKNYSDSIPVIFLTQYDDEVDKISGMRIGADDYYTKGDHGLENVQNERVDPDDYIKKTVEMKFLIARVRALLKRSREQKNLAYSEDDVIRIGDIEVDNRRFSISWEGEEIPMSLTQFWIVQALVQAKGKVLSIDDLMSAANTVVQPNAIQAHIKRIRDRFNAVVPGFSALKNEHGRGYRWVVTE